MAVQSRCLRAGNSAWNRGHRWAGLDKRTLVQNQAALAGFEAYPTLTAVTVTAAFEGTVTSALAEDLRGADRNFGAARKQRQIRWPASRLTYRSRLVGLLASSRPSSLRRPNGRAADGLFAPQSLHRVN